eukprot:m.798 g.798  ORF g.798 m.798 type:complete len:156 (+) comp4891_c0_seq1:34-501(+)
MVKTEHVSLGCMAVLWVVCSIVGILGFLDDDSDSLLYGGAGCALSSVALGLIVGLIYVCRNRCRDDIPDGYCEFCACGDGKTCIYGAPSDEKSCLPSLLRYLMICFAFIGGGMYVANAISSDDTKALSIAGAALAFLLGIFNAVFTFTIQCCGDE